MESRPHAAALAALACLAALLAPEPGRAAVGRSIGIGGVSADGEALYSIPLRLPPGTNGLVPQLALEYRHRQRGGALGVGWSVSGLSRIARCARTVAQDGAAGPVTQTATDRYCLDGQRLVVVNGLAYGAPGAEYRTEIESHARVRSYGTAGNGPQHFIVETADGRALEYGATADSRIDARGVVANGTPTARVWALNRARDRSGNVVDYAYAEDPAQASYRIAAIRYNANPGAGIAAAQVLSFAWESRPSSEVDLAWVAGTPVRDVQRLRRIDLAHEGRLIRRWDLAYEPALSAGGRSRLASVTECGPGGTDCLAASSFRWQDAAGGLGQEATIAAALVTSTPVPDDKRWFTADLNGDGRSDLVWSGGPQGQETLRYRLATANGGLGPEIQTGVPTPYGAGAPFDRDGDGRQDVLMLSAARQWQLLQGTDTGLGAPVAIPLPVPAQLVDYRGLDMNGDGLGDIAWSEIPDYWGNSLRVQLHLAQPGGGFAAAARTLYEQDMAAGYEYPEGGGFLGPPGRRVDFDGDGRDDLLMDENYSVAKITLDEAASEALDSSFRGATTLDLNGDGCTDFAYLRYNGRIHVRVGECRLHWAGPELQGPSWAGHATLTAIDWNGDGNDDLLLAGTTRWQLSLSTGDALMPVVDTGLPQQGMLATRVADFDGDALDDLATRVGSGFRMRLHAGPAPDLLLAATDGFGAATGFEYRPLSDPAVYLKGSGATWPQQDVAAGAWVVAAMTRSDGAGHEGIVTVRHDYAALRRDLTGRGWLGFAMRRSVDASTGQELRLEESWRQDFPYTGLPDATTLRGPGGQPIRVATRQWTALALGSGAARRWHPQLSTLTEQAYEAGGIHDGRLVATSRYAAAAVDPVSGLVTDSNVTVTEHGTGIAAGAVRSERLVHGSVLNDTANWCLGRPQSSQLTASHSLPGGAQLQRNYGRAWDTTRCRVTLLQLEPADPQWRLDLAIGYDAFGNTSSVSQGGPGVTARTTTIAWDSRGRFPLRVTNALSQSQQFDWDAAQGLPLAATDANGLVTRWTWDGHDRLLSVTGPDGTRESYVYAPCDSGCDPRTRLRLWRHALDSTGATRHTSLLDFDRHGRPFREATQRANGGYAVVALDRDARGRPSRLWLPHWTGEAPGAWRQFSHDLLDRPTGDALHAADGSLRAAASLRHDGLALSHVDPTGRSTLLALSAWGSPLQATDAAGGQTGYRHDAFGRLLAVTDATGREQAGATYNPRGMKVAQHDLNLGHWVLTRNTHGDVVALRDAAGATTTFSHDALGRLVGRSNAGGSSSWTWGSSAAARNIGRLAALAGPGYSESLGYDAAGRLASRSIVSDATYRYDIGYATDGAIATLTYPASAGGHRLRLAYERSFGELTRIRDATTGVAYWQRDAEDAAGRVVDETLGAGLRVVSGYDPATGLLDYRLSGGGSVQNLAWRRDAAGRLLRREDLGSGLGEDFRYDALGRLEQARLDGGTALALRYDALGNIRWKSDVCAGTADCYAYHAQRPHAVTAAGAHSFAYDANGRMSRRSGATLAWNAEGLPERINHASGNHSQFWYGPDGNRWKQAASHAGVAETTIYAGGLLEKVTRGGETTWRHYIQAPTGVAAVQLRPAGGAAAKTWYLTHDHLGSVDRIVDGSTLQVAASLSYDAFGSRRGSGWSGPPAASDWHVIAGVTRDGYTGHEHLDALGLVHMGGRVYDPVIGRFLSPDPLVQAPYDSRSLNRYAYAWNDPASLVDPTGLSTEIPCLTGSSGRCVHLTVYGLRGPVTAAAFGGSGQVAAASERDPCGQDSSALACALRRGVIARPSSVVLTPGSGPDPVLATGATGAYWHGLGARVANVFLSGAPVFLLFGADADFEWFAEPAGAAAQRGAAAGNVVALAGGLAGVLRKTATAAISSSGGVLRRFEQPVDQVYYRVYSENAVGKWLTAVPPRSSAWAREALSLPPGNMAAFLQEVRVPAGTLLERSRTLPVPQWGRLRGGAEQFELLEEIPMRNFGPGVPLP